MKKYLFLDIDGVLTRNPKNGPILSEKVDLVNRIVQQSQALVVLSSLRRTEVFLHENEALLKNCGATFSLISETPFFEGYPRGYEIQVWLTDHDVKPNQIVILDDRTDMLHLEGRLVQTDPRVGLEDSHVEKALYLYSV
jgi:HAD domain in Swiss Army Knife RNA repair proteins